MTDMIAFRIDDLPKWETFKEKSEEIAAQVEQSRDLIASTGWDTVRDTACRTLQEGLAGEDGLAWLAHAWALSRELHAAAVESLEDGAAERMVPLDSHPLSQRVSPVVTLSCGPLTLPLAFTLDFSADIECVDLVVQHGRLVAIQAGRLTPSAALSYRGVPLGKKKGNSIGLAKPYHLPRNGVGIVDAAPARPKFDT